jgi:hypothetical protein
LGKSDILLGTEEQVGGGDLPPTALFTLMIRL